MSGAESIEGLCSRCRKAFVVQGTPPHTCPVCGLGFAAARAPDRDGLAECQLCACPALYRQRDFNRRVGLALVVLAALLALAGYAYGGFWIGTGVMIVATLLDRLVYLTRAEVAVCYRCHAVHRGHTLHAGVGPFDLARHDAYRGEAGPAARH